MYVWQPLPKIIIISLKGADNYRVYSNRMQAKKIIMILTFVQFSGKGRHSLTRYIKIHYKNPRMRIFLH